MIGHFRGIRQVKLFRSRLVAPQPGIAGHGGRVVQVALPWIVSKK